MRVAIYARFSSDFVAIGAELVATFVGYFPTITPPLPVSEAARVSGAPPFRENQCRNSADGALVARAMAQSDHPGSACVSGAKLAGR
jgi:hypothetical protein